MFVQGPQHLLDGGVQFGGDHGGGPFPAHVKLAEECRVEVFAVFPAGPGLYRYPGDL
jgi:hypothetical protein